MDTQLECLPCTCRQALEAARYCTDDTAVHERVLRAAMREVSETDLGISSPELAARVHRQIRELTGNPDPYREAKRRSNLIALELYPELCRGLDGGDPLEQAVRLAIAGNIIDLAANPNIAGDALASSVRSAVGQRFHGPCLPQFRTAIKTAERILFLGDNAGEIVLDRMLLEQLPRHRVTYVVKGSPVLNDSTMEDAQAAGITDLVEVIDNGSDIPGTVIEHCSPEFRRRFETAELIIAKGQAHYETLRQVSCPLFYLLMVKCPVIARDIGAELGTLVLEGRNLS
jgi:damage-control phosphatase, subfamily I